PAAMSAVSSAALLRFQLGSLNEVHRDLCVRPAGIKVTARETGTPLTFRKSITFSQVSFSYLRATAPALLEINVTIPQGTLLAVCGPSGSGKSTFVNLLMGLLVPTRGELRADDVSIRGREGDWQRLIALVPQEPFFWNASIRDNLLFGRDVSDAEARIWSALETAHLADFARSLPEKLDARLGERGLRVSGGQRQRLAIARALIGEPELLVLDEPTSALDQEIAHAIDDALVDLKGRKTVVIVAHRAASVARCDQVVYFEAGRIAGSGSLESLADTNPGFGKTLGLAHFAPTYRDAPKRAARV
ncbi:MAG: ATP-binding cassette domain-containing protein, partial [Acidobacteria bacterium]